MTSIKYFFFFLFSLLFVNISFADNIKYGMWDLSFNVQMEGMPFSIPIPAVNIKQCVRPEDTIPKAANEGKDCVYIDQTTRGGMVAWKIKCTKTKLHGEGKITYTGTSMHGLISSQIDMNGQKMVVQTQIKGKFVGACK